MRCHADATAADLLSSLEMSWEFFPPDTAPDVARFFRGGMKTLTPETEQAINRRRTGVASLQGLGPPIHNLGSTGSLSSAKTPKTHS